MATSSTATTRHGLPGAHRMDKSYSIDTNTWEEGMAYEQARDLYILTHQFTPTGNKSNKERFRFAQEAQLREMSAQFHVQLVTAPLLECAGNAIGRLKECLHLTCHPGERARCSTEA
ncbi:hypothetical protein WJX77_010785 [Trebouxia sp. C0004]